MKRRITYGFGFASLAAAGALCALVIAPTAKAWSPTDLPPGWTVHHEVSNAATCPDDYRIFEYTNGVFQDVSGPMCLDSPTYQADFDAWIDARYTAPVTTTAAPPVTTTVVITTTTTTPADTTTAPAAPGPGPAPTPPTSTNVVTVVTTATPVEQSLQAQIDALTAQLAALTDRVTRLEKAGDAAWLAFQQAVAGGADPAQAADTARGTYLNAVYGLGTFAP